MMIHLENVENSVIKAFKNAARYISHFLCEFAECLFHEIK